MGKFFAKKGVDYGRTGWITESGRFIECEPIEHDEVAEKETGKPVSFVEQKWIRISALQGKNLIQFAGKKLTKAQIKAIDEWGIVDWVENGRAKLDQSFIDAYFA